MNPHIQRLRLTIRGRVQGVGFRPFIHRLATEAGLAGYVQNTRHGVVVEIEGSAGDVVSTLMRIGPEIPPPGAIHGLEPRHLDPIGMTHFEIRPSETRSDWVRVYVPADIATCRECLNEIFDPSNLRHRYPFTDCPHCGPRYSIIQRMPYDRSNTSMAGFRMCHECRREYEDPDNRRFHAQSNACSQCGPSLTLYRGRQPVAQKALAMEGALERLREGGIVAIKGVGGYQVFVDSRNETAVQTLRRRMRREAKPFALMCASMEEARRYCQMDFLEQRALQSPEAPIVIMRKAQNHGLVPSIAPDNPCFGVTLPCMSLHHILIHDFGAPLVVTCGNRADEPSCISDDQAFARLGDIADVFLSHDRPIIRPVGDSVVRMALGRELVLRRSRGYAPEPIHVGIEAPPCLAFGGKCKNAVALSVGSEVFLSQHVGDLEHPPSLASQDQTVKGMVQLFGVMPCRRACDRHSDPSHSRHVEVAGIPPLIVEHHHAHIIACMVDNDLTMPVLGFAWDGTGLDGQGVTCGSACLLASRTSFLHVAGLHPFRLAGGREAGRHPRYTALSLLYHMMGDAVLAEEQLLRQLELTPDKTMSLVSSLSKGINAPWCSSMGSLFDGVAALLQLQLTCSFEGQAAARLEYAVRPGPVGDPYPFRLGPWPEKGAPQCRIEWEPMLRRLLDDRAGGADSATCATRFHEGLVALMCTLACEVNEPRVVLSGGCFQNMVLLERGVHRLREYGFQVYTHQRVPPNDGGLALGQVVFAMAQGEHSKPLPNLIGRLGAPNPYERNDAEAPGGGFP